VLAWFAILRGAFQRAAVFQAVTPVARNVWLPTRVVMPPDFARR